MIEPYWHRISRLRDERGLSHGRLYLACGGEVGHETLRRIQRDPEKHGGTNGAARYPSAQVLEIVARALGVDPEEFPEYVLARARSVIDERQVGLEAAFENLQSLLGHTSPSA